MAGQYPQTGTPIGGPGGTNRTQVSLSTNIIIKVGVEAVGALQSITINETRSVKMIDEVGTDGHIDSAPMKSVDIKGTCKRVRLDRLRVAEAFSRGYVHVASQRYPFDIEIIDTQNAPSDSTDPLNDPATIVTKVSNVWITSTGVTYSATDFIIIEDMSFEAEVIKSFFVGGNTAIADGGTRNLTFFKDPIEQSTDVGGRRGSMDAPGLINAFLGGAF
jgi:hypothetical protein